VFWIALIIAVCSVGVSVALNRQRNHTESLRVQTQAQQVVMVVPLARDVTEIVSEAAVAVVPVEQRVVPSKITAAPPDRRPTLRVRHGNATTIRNPSPPVLAPPTAPAPPTPRAPALHDPWQ
jgi:hypothetical protein